MLGLFEFFRSGKMIYFILCLIALYMALRFVFFYYIPSALNFVTMYFIHSIMVCLTIFFAVPLNNSVEMSDSDTDIQIAEPIAEPSDLLSKESSAPQPSAPLQSESLQSEPLQSTPQPSAPLQSESLQSEPLQSTPQPSAPLQSEPLQSEPLQSTPQPSAPLLTQESLIPSTTDVTPTPQNANPVDGTNPNDSLLQPSQITPSSSEQVTKIESISQTPSAPPLSEIMPTAASTAASIADSNQTAASIADSNTTAASTAAALTADTST
jgi:hypothetical protein